MPKYNYKCDKCKISNLNDELIDSLKIWYDHNKENVLDQPLVFEVIHGMHETIEITCPICSSKCNKTLYGSNVEGYIKGNGYLDRSGCKRDMNLHTLINNDPYGGMRQSGEVDYIKDNLKKAGQFKSNKKHYGPKKT